MKTIRISYFLVLIIFTIGSPIRLLASNGGSIQGSVVDAEKQETIVAAAVELLSKSDSTLVKGMITDEKGNYTFENIPQGEYMLRFSCMGYNTKINPAFALTTEKNDIHFSKTNLVASSKSIEEVSIIGKMLTGTMEDDKTMYNVTEEAVKISTSALDLLRQVPDVTVDPINNGVSLDGSSNILYLVNGKKVERDYLQQLGPDIIERYEIITNPGVKYDADVDGVINVILKKNFNTGYSGRADISVPTSDYSYFAFGNANLSYFKNGLRIFLNTYAGKNKWEQEIERNRNLFYDKEINRTERSTDFNSQNSWGGLSYGFDWFINDKNALNFVSSYNPKLPQLFDGTTYKNTYKNDGTIQKSMDEYDNEQKNNYSDYSLYYQRTFDKEGQDLSIELYYSGNTQTQDLTFTDSIISPIPPVEPELINQYPYVMKTTNEFSDNSKETYRTKIDYNHPLNEKIKLSLGASNVNTYFDNSQTTHYYKQGAVPNTSNELQYDELRLAGYANISATAGKVNIQSGIRYESSNIDIHDNSTNPDTKLSYDEWLPYLSLNSNIGEHHSLRLNYRKSITRPRMTEVNAYTSQNDNDNTTRGNSSLQPAKAHRIELNHRVKITGPMFVSYRPYIQYNEDRIFSVSTVNEYGLVSTKIENVNSMMEYGVNLNANLAFVKWWSIMPNVNWTHFDFKESTLYGLQGHSKDNISYGVRNNFQLPKQWTVSANFYWGGTYYQQQTEFTNTDYMQFGFNKQINQNWSISAFMINPFLRTYHSNQSTTTNTYTETNFTNYNYKRLLNFRIAYTFNKGKNGKQIQRNVEGDSEAVRGGGMF